jgi:hypothetical protein
MQSGKIDMTITPSGTQEIFDNHFDYVHYDAVQHRLVSRSEEYRFSSFMKYVGKGFYEMGWGHSNSFEDRGIFLKMESCETDQAFFKPLFG